MTHYTTNKNLLPDGPGYATGDTLANSLRIRNNCPIDGTYLWEHEFVVPAGCTAITPQLYVADAATYTANNWTLVNVSAMRAIWAPGNPT